MYIQYVQYVPMYVHVQYVPYVQKNIRNSEPYFQGNINKKLFSEAMFLEEYCKKFAWDLQKSTRNHINCPVYVKRKCFCQTCDKHVCEMWYLFTPTYNVYIKYVVHCAYNNNNMLLGVNKGGLVPVGRTQRLNEKAHNMFDLQFYV